MEEAYNELYQQFLLLRSICLRQAALLHQLTAAPQKQQGASVTNGEVSDMSSIPVQCTNEIPVCLSEEPELLMPGAQDPAALCNTDHRYRNVETGFGLLTENMSKLNVETSSQRKQDGKTEKINPLFLTLGSSRCNGASSTQSKPHHPAEGWALYNVKMPLTHSPHVACDFRSLSGTITAPLMSEVALQSHVCEFCQAVFPGDATTRGEFVRHLCTHVT
ncbi:uncharacterized protein zgc:113184 [Cololabis saira]|uniref:uncharacterized protein zgc:113184 n=1 Tax=Cololabis saira TaxID=129043 RepID=UPI002AD4C139|nr:uncharacterized protein zgc:113184 [Cololabis saira]